MITVINVNDTLTINYLRPISKYISYPIELDVFGVQHTHISLRCLMQFNLSCVSYAHNFPSRFIDCLRYLYNIFLQSL